MLPLLPWQFPNFSGPDSDIIEDGEEQSAGHFWFRQQRWQAILLLRGECDRAIPLGLMVPAKWCLLDDVGCRSMRLSMDVRRFAPIVARGLELLKRRVHGLSPIADLSTAVFAAEVLPREAETAQAAAFRKLTRRLFSVSAPGVSNQTREAQLHRRT